jgi:hypothetical protein
MIKNIKIKNILNIIEVPKIVQKHVNRNQQYYFRKGVKVFF